MRTWIFILMFSDFRSPWNIKRITFKCVRALLVLAFGRLLGFAARARSDRRVSFTSLKGRGVLYGQPLERRAEDREAAAELAVPQLVGVHKAGGVLEV